MAFLLYLLTRRLQRVLQNQHICVAASAAHCGVSGCRAAARGGAVAAVKMHPCGGHAEWLHIAPWLCLKAHRHISMNQSKVPLYCHILLLIETLLFAHLNALNQHCYKLAC